MTQSIMVVTTTVFFMLIQCVDAYCQQSDSSKIAPQLEPISDSVTARYQFEFTVVGTIGVTRYEDNPTRFSSTNRFRGFAGLLRAMWHPDHLLSIGVTSGYILLSEETFASGTAGLLESESEVQLTAFPILLSFSMQPGNLQIGAGVGAYMLTSATRIAGEEKFTSSDFELGVHTWAGYDFDVFSGFSVGPEVSLHVLSNRGIGAFHAGIRVQYDLLY